MDKYKTPKWLMKVFEDWLDPCPISPTEDGLKMDWKDKTYINPPYSNPLPWVLKAIEESKKGKTIVMLLKADTSTRVFREIILAKAKIFWYNRRMRFNNMKEDAPFPSMLVVLSE